MREYVSIPPVRVLALDPYYAGFGFAVLQPEPVRLRDWGLRTCRRKGSCAVALAVLVKRHEPTLLVLEDCRQAPTPRRRAARAFIEEVSEVLDSSLPVVLYTRANIRSAFAETGAVTKHQIAFAIAREFPELSQRLPPPRQIWESEYDNMHIFDAISLAITHFTLPRERSVAA